MSNLINIFTIVKYDSRVVIYDRKMFITLATGAKVVYVVALQCVAKRGLLIIRGNTLELNLKPFDPFSVSLRGLDDPLPID